MRANRIAMLTSVVAVLAICGMVLAQPAAPRRIVAPPQVAPGDQTAQEAREIIRWLTEHPQAAERIIQSLRPQRDVRPPAAGVPQAAPAPGRLPQVAPVTPGPFAGPGRGMMPPFGPMARRAPQAQAPSRVAPPYLAVPRAAPPAVVQPPQRGWAPGQQPGVGLLPRIVERFRGRLRERLAPAGRCPWCGREMPVPQPERGRRLAPREEREGRRDQPERRMQLERREGEERRDQPERRILIQPREREERRDQPERRIQIQPGEREGGRDQPYRREQIERREREERRDQPAEVPHPLAERLERLRKELEERAKDLELREEALRRLAERLEARQRELDRLREQPGRERPDAPRREVPPARPPEGR